MLKTSATCKPLESLYSGQFTFCPLSVIAWVSVVLKITVLVDND